MGENYTIYNCHIHTFKDVDVPRKFLPLGLVRLLSTTGGFNLLAKALNFFNPLSSDDAFKKYLKFAQTGKLRSQEEIFLQCKHQYPSPTKFIVLSMDMAYMNAGEVPRAYYQQLDELVDLHQKYPQNVMPFIHLDPRRENMNELFFQYIRKGFRGVKIYPPVGHVVDDENLKPIYEYCNEHSIPIMVHCGPQSPTHYRSSVKKIRKLLEDNGIPYEKHMNEMELCAQFGHPMQYESVLKKYPQMNVCLAHWGSEVSWHQYLENPKSKTNWFNIINEMMKEHSNLYTDISFTLNDTRFFSVLKVFLYDEKIKEKVLFGSDYYMVETKSSERKFGFDLRAYLGEDLYKAIAHTNPKKYLCE
jgi:uncharacterized protein